MLQRTTKLHKVTYFILCILSTSRTRFHSQMKSVFNSIDENCERVIILRHFEQLWKIPSPTIYWSFILVAKKQFLVINNSYREKSSNTFIGIWSVASDHRSFTGWWLTIRKHMTNFITYLYFHVRFVVALCFAIGAQQFERNSNSIHPLAFCVSHYWMARLMIAIYVWWLDLTRLFFRSHVFL